MRRGFTLVEILVVLGIIATLLAITIVGLSGTIMRSEEAATRSLIVQLDNVIKQRQKALSELDLRSEVAAFASRSGLTQQQAEFIIRKNLYRQAFPQTLSDLYGFDRDTPPSGAAATALDDAPLLDTLKASGVVLSDLSGEEVFFIALTQGSAIRTHGPVGTVPASKSYPMPTLVIDDIPNRFVEITSTTGDVMVGTFLDAWGTDLAFYNWPTRLIRPDGFVASSSPQVQPIEAEQQVVSAAFISTLPTFTGATLPSTTYSNRLNVDPDDPLNTLTPLFMSGTATVNFGGSSITIATWTEDTYHCPTTYHTPLIVSAGPDLESGIVSPDGLAPDTDTTISVQKSGYPVVNNYDPASPDPAERARHEMWQGRLFDNVTNRQGQ